jgi:hypothetical protein
VSSHENANIVVIKESPDASNPILKFCSLYLIYDLACALGYRS